MDRFVKVREKCSQSSCFISHLCDGRLVLAGRLGDQTCGKELFESQIIIQYHIEQRALIKILGSVK